MFLNEFLFRTAGMGEFTDLKMMVDWCVKSGLQIIQILPINDSGEDPSPYRYDHTLLQNFDKVCAFQRVRG